MVKVCLALLLGLALASTTFKPTSPVMTQETVDHVNNNAKWTASLEWVGEMTIEEAKSMVGTDLNDYNPYPKRDFGALLDYTSIPTSFDSREQWPGCVHDILNQERCGSCWAFAGSESLSDRYCVQKQMDVVLSPQWLVSCDTGNMGCNGGMLSAAWSYMESHGIPTLACDPYVSGQGDSHSGECNITYNPDTCDEETMYKATNIGGFTSASDIQMEIMRGGPVETGFTVYSDFYSYKTGVYTHTYGQELGGHAVKIIGWGQEEDGTDYWIVANSWGTSWGMSGFFNIAFGQCGIDSDVYAGDAA